MLKNYFQDIQRCIEKSKGNSMNKLNGTYIKDTVQCSNTELPFYDVINKCGVFLKLDSSCSVSLFSCKPCSKGCLNAAFQLSLAGWLYWLSCFLGEINSSLSHLSAVKY